MRHANPWRFAFELHPLTRPFIAAALLAPRETSAIAARALGTAALVDRLGLERAALAGTSFAYAVEYFRGVREAAGSREQAARDYADFVDRFERGAAATEPRALETLAS